MSSLARTTVVWTVLVSLACLGCAVLGRPRPRLVQAGLAVSGVGALGVSVLAAVRLLVATARPADLPTHLGYLLTAPVLLPVTAGLVGRDRGRWGSACFAVAGAVLVVVLVRLVVTARA